MLNKRLPPAYHAPFYFPFYILLLSIDVFFSALILIDLNWSFFDWLIEFYQIYCIYTLLIIIWFYCHVILHKTSRHTCIHNSIPPLLYFFLKYIASGLQHFKADSFFKKAVLRLNALMLLPTYIIIKYLLLYHYLKTVLIPKFHRKKWLLNYCECKKY